jgi:hypothetical protein
MPVLWPDPLLVVVVQDQDQRLSFALRPHALALDPIYSCRTAQQTNAFVCRAHRDGLPVMLNPLSGEHILADVCSSSACRPPFFCRATTCCGPTSQSEYQLVASLLTHSSQHMLCVVAAASCLKLLDQWLKEWVSILPTTSTHSSNAPLTLTNVFW